MTKILRLLTILIAVCSVSALLAGCSAPFEPGEVIVAAPLHLLEEDEIDIDALREWAETYVRATLPRAYYQGMMCRCESDSLPGLRGRLVFVFGQPTQRLFRRGFLRASVTIHTESGQATIWYQDLTGRYPNTDPWPIAVGAQVREGASIANQHLLERGVTGCTIGVSDQGDRWGVMSHYFDAECACTIDFEIVDGEIHEQRETICRDDSS